MYQKHNFLCKHHVRVCLPVSNCVSQFPVPTEVPSSLPILKRCMYVCTMYVHTWPYAGSVTRGCGSLGTGAVPGGDPAAPG